ncbi:hypothetical protein EIP91_005705 [Steccherinum ochraceum]|uniref:Succinyl-CoA:3-ketoacid-coenzyme A transferase n=1 Tax=Steccherinum ochraceum TaxID=92696 RepID=A0A4R0R9K8_9APHY|nr:hypothetical protein EIP91_005705 [Steccherinum ochraceum]
MILNMSARRLARGPFSRLSSRTSSPAIRLAPVKFYSVVADGEVPTKSKVWDSVEEAVQVVKSGDTLLSGGFGLCGTPDTLIAALSKRPEVRELTAVSNNVGSGENGLGKLLYSGHIGKMMASYIGGNKHFESLYLNGEIGLELIPQGTLAARLRAHAAGTPAFYTPTGAHTAVETGEIPIRYKAGGMKAGVDIPGNKKEWKEFNGRRYLMEPAIPGDIAFIRAWKVDEAGNCVFRYTTQNFSAVMAKNAKVTIVEAENIVPIGSISPNMIHLPGIYVDRIVKATAPKQIEFEVLASSSQSEDLSKLPPEKRAAVEARHRIAKRAAQEIQDGFYVNLGIGMPTLVPEVRDSYWYFWTFSKNVVQYLKPGVKVWWQSENGILGMGPYPQKHQVDPDLINAGKETVTLLPGASVFDSAESFDMIRGGHIDIAILGAMQVSGAGDIANFMIPGKLVKGIGGAMDLVSNPDKTKVIAVMEHCAKDGSSKILEQCALPLTGARAVSQIVTELAVFNVDRAAGRMTLTELAPNVTLEEVRAKTGASFEVASKLGQMPLLRLRLTAALLRRPYSIVTDVPIPRKSKVWDNVHEAIADVKSGDVVLSGGFGLCGVPETLIKALSKRTDVKNLIAVSNNAGALDSGLVRLIKSHQLDKLIISYLGGNKFLESAYLSGDIGIELVPQGTLIARLNAHAAGYPVIYTPTGAGTKVETGEIPIRFNPGGGSKGVKVPGNKKEAREFNGKRYIMEPAIPGDVALVHAWKADETGNLVFRYTANNYNAVMARNAKLTIVEAEEIVPAGSLSPNAIHVPGIFVDRIVRASEPKPIEVLALAKNKDEHTQSVQGTEHTEYVNGIRSDWRHRIASRAAKEIQDGSYVNLGVGIPTLVPEHLPSEVKIWMESENGILGMGSYPTQDQADPDIINAGKETTTLVPGASVFDSIESFNMIRGGHLDVTILGAMEVSQAGDIANFMIPGKLVKGIGGAMDLVSNPDQTKVIVTMQHCSKDGSPKIVQECTLPLTGPRAVSMIVTDMAVFNVDRTAGELHLVDMAEGVTVEELKSKTACDFHVPAMVGRF